MVRVLVAGAPRSGTTWVERVLASDDATHEVHEPDNDLNDSFALVAKTGIGRFPVLARGELPEDYERLWSEAIVGGKPLNTPAARSAQVLLRTARRTSIDNVLDRERDLLTRLYSLAFTALARPRSGGSNKMSSPSVAKTVHASFCLEAIVERWPETKVLIVRRNPLNAVGSWMELGWNPLKLWEDPDVLANWIEPYEIKLPGKRASLLTKLAWDYCLLDDALARSSARNPLWEMTTHEAICEDPVEAFRTIFGRLGLTFTSSIEKRIEAANTSGDGYQTNRVAADQVYRWKSRLTEKQIEEIRDAARCFTSFVGVLG